MTRIRVALALSMALGCAGPALASGPEQVEQIEPEGGEWQAEASFLASRGSAGEPSIQLLRGISDRIALGVEVEGEWSNGKLAIEGFAPTILVRFSDPSEGVGVGVVGQVEFATDFAPVGAEARLLVERKARRWWGQANLIATIEREDGRSESALGYSWRISRAVGESLWLGAEGSGRMIRLGGAGDRGGQYLGPALTSEHDLRSGREIEFNASFLRRVAGAGPRGAVQLSAQVGF